MADQLKSLSEIAQNTRKTAMYVHPVFLVSPEFVTITSAQSPYTLPTNTRSVTFTLWNLDVSNPITIAFPNTTKTFAADRYHGFTFSYAIDIQRDCELVNDITITIAGINLASVDINYTTA